MKPPPVVRKTTAVFHQSGALQVGKGKITGIIALTLGGLAVLAVLAFHFPEYLTTPDLRKKYDVGLLRHVLLVGMVIAGGMAIANLVQRRNRWLNGTALALILIAAAMGGHRVPVSDFPDDTPYIGLDWFILDLLGSSLIFILIEKMAPLHRDQPVFRPGWQTDFTHFIVNHLLVGLALLIVNFAIHRLFGWLVWDPLQKWVGGLPFFAALFLLGVGWTCMIVAGTTLFAQSYRPNERPRAQALGGLLNNLAGATAALTAGLALQTIGWTALNFGLLPILALSLVMILRWVAAPKPLAAVA